MVPSPPTLLYLTFEGNFGVLTLRLTWKDQTNVPKEHPTCLIGTIVVVVGAKEVSDKLHHPFTHPRPTPSMVLDLLGLLKKTNIRASLVSTTALWLRLTILWSLPEEHLRDWYRYGLISS